MYSQSWMQYMLNQPMLIFLNQSGQSLEAHPLRVAHTSHWIRQLWG